MNATNIQTMIDGALQFVEITSFGMKRACDEIIVHRSMQKKAADLAPEVVALMLKTGAIRADQEDAASAMLGSHAETMQLLKNSIDKWHKLSLSKKAGDLGAGEDDPTVKQGEYDSLNDPVVGRKTGRKKASDFAMLRVMDEPVRR